MRKSFVLSLLVGLVVLSACVASPAQIGVGISVNFGPPALPVYAQPICPAPGYMWTPGYWAWDPNVGQYYWVPGTWVMAPQPGFLWTPPWWGWSGGVFLFHAGWWGPHIGFYGGINYGFGYPGTGFWGGRWQGNNFYYNRSVTNINTTNVTNVYNTTVVNNSSHVSYNGGQGGTTAQPTAEEKAAENERHEGPVAAQTQHEEAARANPEMRANENHGKPPVAATQKPGDFKGSGVEAAKEAGAPYKAPENAGRTENNAGRPENNVPRPPGATDSEEHPEANNVPKPPSHASDVQPHQFEKPNTGDANLDQKYQQEQDKLNTKMTQQHQQLQQRQEQEHQQAQQKNYNDAQKQQMEQRHQQQTTKMEQKHTQQIQHMQQHQQPHSSGGGGAKH
jgi:hypothetical protein